jgi:hypothetical protein
MSLRKSRKRSLVQRALKLWTGAKAVKVARKVVAKRAPAGGAKRMAIGAAALAAVAVVVRKRKSRSREAELGLGPPNESVPSHETIAPAKEAAGQAA